MERPTKRPRLLTPLDSVYNASYSSQHAYYEMPDNVSNDFEVPEEADDVDKPIYDPDQELQQKRARVDFKLKSTFEAIFEKYGKDFGCIGDEIDMRTGEILVNNGHVLSMRHEMDAGDFQSCSEELEDDPSGSEDDVIDEDEDDEDRDVEDDSEDELDEDDEEDYDEEDPLGDGEMVEDDMILRGFAQARQQLFNRQPPHQPRPSRDLFAECTEPQHVPIVRPNFPKTTLPSRSEILAQFGPQLGPEIVKYVSTRGVPENNKIEPAWRVPYIEPASHVANVESAWRLPDIQSNPPPTPVRRPLIRSMVIQPESELERSPSPENAPSIWAVTARKSSRKSASRKRFSPHEDRLLLTFVADARRRGLDLSKMSTWQQLEAMNPRRDYKSWKQRYSTKFTYLRPSHLDESDLSTSEASSSTAQIPDQRRDFGIGFENAAPPHPSRLAASQRPARARKPAQREGIVSWSEAIATIASVDPVGNAGLLDDVRRTGYRLAYELPVPSIFSNRRHSLDGSTPRQPVDHNRAYPPRPEQGIDPLGGAEEELTLNGPAIPTKESTAYKAPCPHANCKTYSTTLYRIERGYDEELSPMCSHLLYEHHISPFPCGETNCERKGAQGYFMQNELVRHVREAHPYAAALHRLRGRVDSALLKQNNHSDKPRQSIEVHRSSSISKQPRDSDFMVHQRLYTSHGLSSSRRAFFGSDQDPNSIPRTAFRPLSPSASSMHVHPSPPRAKDISSMGHREASSDSDLQILDGNPFKGSDRSKNEGARNCVNDHDPTSGPSFTHVTASQNIQASAQHDITYKNPCEMVANSHPGNNNAYQTVQENHSRSSNSPKESQSTSTPPLPATLLHSRSSPKDMQSRASFLRPEIGEASEAVKTNKPFRHAEEGFIDRSYELSDEEDGIRPGIRRQHQRPSLPHKPPQLPHACFAPSAKIESPQLPLAPAPPTVVAHKSPYRLNLSIVTPPSKLKSRNSATHNVLATDEFDELSLGEDGFILLSTRRKSDKSPKFVLSVEVKREEEENLAPVSEVSKRRLSGLDDDEADELAEDMPSMSTPRQPGTTTGSKPTSTRDSGAPSMRPVKNLKSRKMPSDKLRFQPGSSRHAALMSHKPPINHQYLPPIIASTPLFDLEKRSSGIGNETEGSRAEIPSTSELGSSPNSHPVQSREQRTNINFNVAVTPHKTWASRTIKLEDENDGVVTPGGTLRRCGHDGYVCGRTFCFSCQSDD